MLTLPQICAQLGGRLIDDNGIEVRQIASLAHAQSDEISFLTDARYLKQLESTQAGAIIVPPKYSDACSIPRIVADNPYVYYAKVAAILNRTVNIVPSVHATAIIETGAVVSPKAHVGAYAVIAKGCVIGDNSYIGPGCILGANVEIGDGTQLQGSVTIYHESKIGCRCLIHSGTVIGADGFGHAEEAGCWLKIPQIGRVIIGNDVEIGANTTIDRGALDDTVIEDGVKLDNQIQIGHNCKIGAHTVIAGCVGVAGSAVIGKHCKIGGAAMILGHLEITDSVTISPGSMITRSISQSGTYSAIMPFQNHQEWLKTAANIRHLETLVQRVSSLEKQLNLLKEKSCE